MNSKSVLFIFSVGSFLVFTGVQSFGQTAAAINVPPATAIQTARAARNDLVLGILKNSTSTAAAIAQLKASKSPTGHNYKSTAADFAFAAIDMGHRLSITGKPTAAKDLFQAAEIALAALVAKTPDSEATDKAQYLQSLALIRGRYLGEFVQAKDDITNALRLQPGDSASLGVRNLLASEQPALFAASN